MDRGTIEEKLARSWPPKLVDFELLDTVVAKRPSKTALEKDAEFDARIRTHMRGTFPEWGVTYDGAPAKLLWVKSEISIKDYNVESETIPASRFIENRRTADDAEAFTLTNAYGATTEGYIQRFTGGVKFMLYDNYMELTNGDLPAPRKLLENAKDVRLYLGARLDQAAVWCHDYSREFAISELSMKSTYKEYGTWTEILTPIELIVLTDENDKILAIKKLLNAEKQKDGAGDGPQPPKPGGLPKKGTDKEATPPGEMPPGYAPPPRPPRR